MNLTVEEYTKFCARYNLTPLQALWILNLYEDKVPMPEKRFYMKTADWKDLRERNIVSSDRKVSTAFVENAFNSIRKKKKKSLGELRATVNDKVREIIQYISETLLNEFEDVKPKIQAIDRIIKKMDGNKELAGLYMTWLWLFPTNGKDNKSWEYLFGTKYDNVVLRRSTDMSINNFIKMAKKYDIGIYILATFMFIKSHIKEDGKCFIPKIENYFKSQMDWYDEAVELVDESESKEDIYPIFEYKVDEKVNYTTHGASLL